MAKIEIGEINFQDQKVPRENTQHHKDNGRWLQIGVEIWKTFVRFSAVVELQRRNVGEALKIEQGSTFELRYAPFT